MRNSWIRGHPLWTSVLIGLALIAVSPLFKVSSTSSNVVMDWTFAVGVFFLAGIPTLYLFWRYYKCFDENLDVVMQGIPSPQEIRLQFIQTQGREPTAQEVAAIHQMATSRHQPGSAECGASWFSVRCSVLGRSTVRVFCS